MKYASWIVGSAVVLCVVLQPWPGRDTYVIQGGNGKGKGPKCKTEPICDPAQCLQVACESNNPCKCECVPIPDCSTEPL